MFTVQYRSLEACKFSHLFLRDGMYLAEMFLEQLRAQQLFICNNEAKGGGGANPTVQFNESNFFPLYFEKRYLQRKPG